MEIYENTLIELTDLVTNLFQHKKLRYYQERFIYNLNVINVCIIYYLLMKKATELTTHFIYMIYANVQDNFALKKK